jgi:hypothetical protein
MAYIGVLVAVWTVLKRYRGITHDAQLYVLQAVTRLDPVPLANDVFLRFESQDRFSMFSIVFAQVIAALGVDRAAAVSTLSLQLTWLILAWAIARKLQDWRLALLSIPLLTFIPGWYGAREVFRYAEPFITARCASEVISLAALLAMLHYRRVLGVALLVAALMIHPLMAFPMILLAGMIQLRPSGWRQWSALYVCMTAGAMAGSYVLALPEPFMQGNWLELTRSRSLFLFTDHWISSDWAVAAQIILTLVIAALALPNGTARDVSRAALCLSIVGLSLTIVSSEVAPFKLLLQGQPWRWMWVGRFVATLLLPLALLSMWRRHPAGRSAAVLLAGGWFIGTSGSLAEVPPIGANGLLCLMAALVWADKDRLSSRGIAGLRALSFATVLLCAAVLLSATLVAADAHFSLGHDPLWVQRFIDVADVPGVPIIIVGAAWYLIIVQNNRFAATALVVCGVILATAAWPETVRRWSSTQYDEAHRSRFAEWRAHIPVNAEVLWTNTPLGPWLLLDRKSYLTVSQGAGTVFSAETATELRRRADNLASLVSPGKWFLEPDFVDDELETLTPDILRQICADRSLGFVASSDRMDVAVAEAEWPRRGDRLFLYDCRQIREAPVT